MIACVSRASRLLLAIPVLWTACSTAPPAAADNGRLLFNANCARCHGPEAQGTAAAPALPDRVRGMSEDRFLEQVLRRYAWSVPAAEAGSEGALREAMIRGLMQPKAEPGAMPVWQDRPAVRAGVHDLYLVLQARRPSVVTGCGWRPA